MRSLWGWLVVVCACGSIAFADDLGKAREHYRNATRAYELGSYDEAIREYSEAYRLKDDPAILYNLAQAHRLAEHNADALRLYRMYLIKVPDAENRAEVNAKIEALQKLLDEQKRAKSLPPDTTLPRAPEASPAPAPPTEAPAAVIAQPAPAARPIPVYKKGWFWGVIVGVVAVGAAVGVAVALTTPKDATFPSGSEGNVSVHF